MINLPKKYLKSCTNNKCYFDLVTYLEELENPFLRASALTAENISSNIQGLSGNNVAENLMEIFTLLSEIGLEPQQDGFDLVNQASRYEIRFDEIDSSTINPKMTISLDGQVVYTQNLGGQWFYNLEDAGELNCGNDYVVTIGSNTVEINGDYLGWSAPEMVQWSDILVFDDREWTVFIDSLETDFLPNVATAAVTRQFGSFYNLVQELNLQLIDYGSSFRLLAGDTGNRIVLADIDYNPIQNQSSYIGDNGFQNMVVVIEDTQTNSNWLIKGTNPKDVSFQTISFIQSEGISKKTIPCLCTQIAETEVGIYNGGDKLVVLTEGDLQALQGYVYDNGNTGDGLLANLFTPNNQYTVSVLNVDGIPYISSPFIGVLASFSQIAEVLNSFGSPYIFGTKENNVLYIVNSDTNPLDIVIEIYNDSLGDFIIKGRRPSNIEVSLDSFCKLVTLNDIEEVAGNKELSYDNYTVVMLTPNTTAILPQPKERARFNIKNASVGEIFVDGNIDGQNQQIALQPSHSLQLHSSITTFYII